MKKFNTKVSKILKFTGTALVTSALLSVSMAAQALDAVAYYSDKNSNRVFIIDPRNMSLVDTIPTIGSDPYPIDKVGGNKVYVTTRETESLDIIDYDGTNFSNSGVISLTHKPRSVTYNANKQLALVSGTKKAVMSVIDTTTDTVVGTVGNTTVQAPTDFGGSLATGHPFWVNDKQFLLTDRARRKVHLYKVVQWGGTYYIWKQHTINTRTSVHSWEKVPNASGFWQKRFFYGVEEGSPNSGKEPAVLEIFVYGNHIFKTRRAKLTGFDPSTMGSHHLAMHPNKQHIYIGSAEGHTFVINRYAMGIQSVVDSGKNAGHTTFNSATNVAVTTNHKDTFMTLIDMTTHTKIGDVANIATANPANGLSQSHTTSFDPNNNGFYYTSAASDGNYVEVDALSGNVTRTLPLDLGNGYTIQGTYNWNLQ